MGVALFRLILHFFILNCLLGMSCLVNLEKVSRPRFAIFPRYSLLFDDHYELVDVVDYHDKLMCLIN
jgi:hypothetical protein